MNTDRLPELTPTQSRPRWVWVLMGAVLAAAVIGSVLLGVGRSSVPLALARPHDGAPKLLIDKTAIDFGAVPYRKMIHAAFELTNGGNEVLEFIEAPYIEVVKGCCPPSPVLGKKALKPGEATTVSVSFMMYQGMGGRHDFRVHLRTNDPSQPDRTVQVLSDWK